MAKDDSDLLDELDSTDFELDNIAKDDDIDFLAGLDLSETDDDFSFTGSDNGENKLENKLEKLFQKEKSESEKLESNSEIGSDEKKNFFKKIIDSVVNFVKTEKVISIVIASLVVLLLILIILVCTLTGKNKKAPPEKPAEDSVKLPYDYILPSSEILDSYTFSRDLRDRWTLEEGKKWFEIPDGTMMKELEDKNSENIFEILEEVP